MVVVVVVVEVVVEVAVVEEVMSVGGRTRCFSLPVGMVVFGGGSIFFVESESTLKSCRQSP